MSEDRGERRPRPRGRKPRRKVCSFCADKTVQIPVLNDSTDEPDETVSLSLSNFAGGATVGNPNAAMLTLVDDDAAAPGGDTIFASGFEGM